MDKDQVLAWLGRRRAWRIVEGMARYGIYTDLRVFGVSMGTLLSLAKRIGKDHALAKALWESGWYEARMLAALVDDAHRVTRRQMNAWAGDFDNWAIYGMFPPVRPDTVRVNHGVVGRREARGTRRCRLPEQQRLSHSPEPWLTSLLRRAR